MQTRTPRTVPAGSGKLPWIGFALFTLTSAVFATLFFLEREERIVKERDSDVAEKRARDSEALRLVTESRLTRPVNPGLSLLLALESASLNDSKGGATQHAILQALGSCHEARTLIGHRGAVLSAVFGPDGQEVLTASADRTARLWNPFSGECVRVFSGHEGAVLGAAFSPDGGRVLTYSLDGTARILETSSGALLGILVRDLEAENRPALTSARFDHAGRTIVTTSIDGRVELYDGFEGSWQRTLLEEDAPVLDAIFTGDDFLLTTLSSSGEVVVVRTDDGALIRRYKTPGPPGAHLAVDSYRNLCLGSGSVLDLSRGGTFLPGRVPAGLIDPVRESFLVFTEILRNGTVEDLEGIRPFDEKPDVEPSLYRFEDLDEPLRLDVPSIRAAAFSRDGELVAVASNDRIGRVLRTFDGSLVAQFLGHEQGLRSIAFDPEGRRVLTSSNDLTARIWTLTPYSIRPVSIPERPEVRSRRLAERRRSSSDWLFGELDTSNDPPAASETRRNERFRVVSDDRGRLDVFERKPRRRLVASYVPEGEDTAPFWTTATTDDGRYVLAGSRRGAILWDTRSNEVHNVMDLEVYSASFSGDGEKILLAGKGWALVLSTADRERIVDFGGGICSARFSPDATLVLTFPSCRMGGESVRLDGAPAVWDAGSGELIARYHGHTLPWIEGEFDPTGRFVITEARGGESGFETEVWPVHPLQAALALKPRDLSPREREQFQIGLPEEREKYREEWLQRHFQDR